MFRKVFQNGSYVEIFNIQKKECIENWKISSPHIKKIYDRKAKGYVLSLIGNTVTTWMQLPSDLKEGLNLLQSLLIFQLIVSKNKNFSLEVIIALASGDRKRIVVSTSQKNLHVTPLLAKLPFIWEQKGTWINLCFDLEVLSSDLWKEETFSSIECITLHACCQLKRIFTLNKSFICLQSYKYLKQHLLSFLPSQFIMPGVYDVCLVDCKNKDILDISKESEQQTLSVSNEDKSNDVEVDTHNRQKICEDKTKKCNCNKKTHCSRKLVGKIKTNNKKENSNHESKKFIFKSRNNSERLKIESKLEKNHCLSDFETSNQFSINQSYIDSSPRKSNFTYSPTKYTNILKNSDNILEENKTDTNSLIETYNICNKNFICDELQSFYDEQKKEWILTKENISGNRIVPEKNFKTEKFYNECENKDIQMEKLMNELQIMKDGEKIPESDLLLQIPNEINKFEINISKIDKKPYSIFTREYDKNKYISINSKDFICQENS